MSLSHATPFFLDARESLSEWLWKSRSRELTIWTNEISKASSARRGSQQMLLQPPDSLLAFGKAVTLLQRARQTAPPLLTSS